ncbi:cytochrome P450 [Dacryopinax primogenitus]|uniref:Cytochrome P450 n=1 Tax=Dacryopinax primogenitus (strain DJM 731) TaxID=1858805 RepID=M5G579_DACPD|nr:cytochrome P450 [Dacryopinax primogenitus]EJT98912.1 cytochrome P450 [Dacryopinax primogenitus]
MEHLLSGLALDSEFFKLGGTVLGLCLLFLVTSRYTARKGIKAIFPPGPTGLPLVRNLLQFPSHFFWYQLDAWSKLHGPVYTFWIMNQPFVVLNTAAAAADVLDHQSGITSGRLQTIKGAFYGVDRILTTKAHSLGWRAARKAMHASFNIHSTLRFGPLQAYDATNLCLGLIRYPNKPFHLHVHRWSASIIFRCLYGHDAFDIEGDDPSTNMRRLAEELVQALLPQNSIVDIFPFLTPLIQRSKWLRREADTWKKETDDEGNRLYDGVDPTATWSTFVGDLNTNLEKYGLTKEDANWLSITVYIAGQETTAYTLRVLMLAILHNPAVAKAAQSQLDSICGSRAPSFEHREQLPYIEALIKETMRWRPVVPGGVPHLATEDVEFQGFVVPKGTIFFDNIWSQSRDPAVYPDPDAFDPTRFLDAEGCLIPQAPDIPLLAFGRGRRVCPGRDFASNGLFIVTATLLWAFDFEWPVDSKGKPIMCGTSEMEDHVVLTTVRSFDVKITPRREGLEEKLIEILAERDTDLSV